MNQNMYNTIQKLAGAPPPRGSLERSAFRRQSAASSPMQKFVAEPPRHVDTAGVLDTTTDALKLRLPSTAGPAAQAFAQGARNEYLQDPFLQGAVLGRATRGQPGTGKLQRRMTDLVGKLQPQYDNWLANKFGQEGHMNQNMFNTIQKLAGAAMPDTGLSDRIIDDLVKGAQANPRTGQIQFYQEQAEQKLASAGVTALDVAHMVGTLRALDEAGFSKKEAAEYLGVVEEAIEDVLKVTTG